MPDFQILPEFAERIFWNKRGTCGNAGCTDPECCCSLCARPIGVDEEDPRWDTHDEYCEDCELCRDRVPAMLFRGEGKETEGAQFHWNCFIRMIGSPAQPGSRGMSVADDAPGPAQ